MKNLRIIFVNYGSFESNSGGHIGNFGSGLAKLGHTVAICAQGDAQGARAVLSDAVLTFTHEELDFDPSRLAMCGSSEIPLERTIVHAWTPRALVVSLCQALFECGIKNYVVHLEDNEELLAATNLGLSVDRFRKLRADEFPNPYPPSLSRPDFRYFLEYSSGVTVIVPPLAEFLPSGVPWHLLEPGVNMELFGKELPLERRCALRKELGIGADEYVCVYHGNMHSANEREIFSLYTSILILKRRGRRVRLVRAGKDFTSGLDISYADLKSDVEIDLGYLPFEKLVEVLKMADFFVQPGCSNAFNDYRFPSKLPEFLACGRPVVLPASNIGLRMVHETDALLLHRGDGVEIADLVERILDERELSRRLSENARRFASTELDWSKNCEMLLAFYERVLYGESIQTRDEDGLL